LWLGTQLSPPLSKFFCQQIPKSEFQVFATPKPATAKPCVSSLHRALQHVCDGREGSLGYVILQVSKALVLPSNSIKLTPTGTRSRGVLLAAAQDAVCARLLKSPAAGTTWWRHVLTENNLSEKIFASSFILFKVNCLRPLVDARHPAVMLVLC
jgi:hypothetical protein